MKKLRRYLTGLLTVCLVLCLCACGEQPATSAAKPAETTAPGADDATVTYRVKVADEAGEPLSGVPVQLCKDYCVFALTNDAGIAEFLLAEDAYHASVMALPEGYAHVSDQVEFDFEEGSTELTITLKTAG